MYAHYRKSPLKEDNLSTKYKMAGPEGVLIERFHLYSETTCIKRLLCDVPKVPTQCILTCIHFKDHLSRKEVPLAWLLLQYIKSKHTLMPMPNTVDPH